MKLLTDYPQFYDSIFDNSGPVFERMAFTRGGLTKRAQFDLFTSLGLKTPPHGTIKELAAHCLAGNAPRAILSEVFCVVYHDELAHRGEGKVLISLEQAVAEHPDAFASLFIPSRSEAVIFRQVRFGQLNFWLRQQAGQPGWRSNVADAEGVLEKTVSREPNPIPRVLWAIDFLPSPNGLLALDFNTAPELVTLGEAGTLAAEEVLQELQWIATTAPEQLQQF